MAAMITRAGIMGIPGAFDAGGMIPSTQSIWCEAMGLMVIKVGDVLTMKKKHPCGSYTWRTLRIGADFKLKCTGCGHEIMSPRRKIEKSIKSVKEMD